MSSRWIMLGAIAMALLGRAHAAAEDRLEAASVLFLDDLESSETSRGADMEEGERLDVSPPSLAGISFQRVFADSELLLAQKQPSRDAALDFSPRRDPYFGFDRITQFSWAPSNLAHKTLYFEDDSLERHGYTHAPLLQPFISAVEFAKDGLAAPIRGVFDGPHKRHFLAGRARVGSCALPLKERIVPCKHR